MQLGWVGHGPPPLFWQFVNAASVCILLASLVHADTAVSAASSEESSEASYTFFDYASLAIKWLWNCFFVMGAVIQYLPQWKQIRAGKGEAFSPLICLILLSANILRLFYWLGERFDQVLVWQSVVMVLVQFVVLHAVCEDKLRRITTHAAASFDNADAAAAGADSLNSLTLRTDTPFALALTDSTRAALAANAPQASLDASVDSMSAAALHRTRAASVAARVLGTGTGAGADADPDADVDVDARLGTGAHDEENPVASSGAIAAGTRALTPGPGSAVPGVPHFLALSPGGEVLARRGSGGSDARPTTPRVSSAAATSSRVGLRGGVKTTGRGGSSYARAHEEEGEENNDDDAEDGGEGDAVIGGRARTSSISLRRQYRAGFTRPPRTIFDLKLNEFWQWDLFSSYVIFLAGFSLVLAVLCALFIQYAPFVAGLGFVALLVEALLGIPQAYRNCHNGTNGLSAFLIWSWLLGDAVKTVFYIVLGAPVPFLVCGTFQVCVDIFVLGQIFMVGHFVFPCCCFVFHFFVSRALLPGSNGSLLFPAQDKSPKAAAERAAVAAAVAQLQQHPQDAIELADLSNVPLVSVSDTGSAAGDCDGATHGRKPSLHPSSTDAALVSSSGGAVAPATDVASQSSSLSPVFDTASTDLHRLPALGASAVASQASPELPALDVKDGVLQADDKFCVTKPGAEISIPTAAAAVSAAALAAPASAPSPAVPSGRVRTAVDAAAAAVADAPASDLSASAHDHDEAAGAAAAAAVAAVLAAAVAVAPSSNSTATAAPASTVTTVTVPVDAVAPSAGPYMV
jgi:hypothetical protein